MLLNNYICALDIGSSKICAVVAKIKKRQIDQIFFDQIPSRGIKQGSIVNSIELTSSISSILKTLRSKSGIKIKSIYTNISGQQISTKHSRAVIPLAERGNRVITSYDVQNVIEQARILGSNLEEEVIQEIPLSYTVDSNSGILNPVGLYSHKLEVDLYLVCGKLSFIQTLARIVSQAGYEIKDLFLSGLVTSSLVLGNDNRGETEVFCDIGSDTTEILLFKNRILKEIRILSIGGDDLTIGIADAFDISFESAEEIKLSSSVIGGISSMNQDREVLVKKNNQYKPIKQKAISEAVTPKAKLMCETIKKTLDSMISPQRQQQNPDNFIVTGRAVLTEGFLEALEGTLGFSVKLGRINNKNISSLLNKESSLSEHKYLTYITALGIISQTLYHKEAPLLSGIMPASNPTLRLLSKIRQVYQDYF